jgi:Zn finger protein HypA/HybF involved in hydrogenase expression
MHELSIAVSIVELVEEELKEGEHRGSPVQEILVEIGSDSGVVVEALEFVWPEVVKGSLLEGAELKIKRSKGKELRVRSVKL